MGEKLDAGASRVETIDWAERHTQLTGWLIRCFGLRHEDAEDAAQDAWIKVRGHAYPERGLYWNAGRQAAIDLMRHSYFHREQQPDGAWNDTPSSQDVEREVMLRETLRLAARHCPTAFQEAIGQRDWRLKDGTRKARIHYERTRWARIAKQ
jgi:DNA-directed RNA polymerase specialized sigma24 family protein